MSTVNVHNQIVTWRRVLHEHPELSFNEIKTSQLVFDTLNTFDHVIVSRPTKTSVMAILKGHVPGNTIAFRADMDALPIQEETNIEFRSKNLGVMHACGHDAHTAMLLGAVQQLTERGNNFAGEIRFLFQHAEELYPGGAVEMVESGVLDGVDRAFALHVSPDYSTGQFVYRKDVFCSTADDFFIKIYGRGGHAGTPSETIDPLIIGAEIVSTLQTIVSRKIPNSKAPIITVAKFHCGTATNVIADTAELAGTIRSHDEDTRIEARALLEKIVHGIAEIHGARGTVEWEIGCPPVINDEETTDISVEAAKKIFGQNNLVNLKEPFFGTEDFAIMSAVVPASYQFMGVHHPKLGEPYPLHHPKFILDEDALVLGTNYFVEVANILCPSILRY